MRKAAKRGQRAPRAAELCPLAGAMRFLSGAWTPYIIWYLREGPRRFGDLKRDIGEVSAKVLTDRLRELEALGVVSRTVKPTSPPTVEYALTALGVRLKPILNSMAAVGSDLHRRRAGRAAEARGL